MDRDVQNELDRLDQSLLKFCPSRKWAIQTVTFPANPNTDLDIAHGLKPNDPESVAYAILQASQPCVLWTDTSADRIPATREVMRIRCTAPSARVTLLLYVTATSTALAQSTVPHAFAVGTVANGQATIGIVSGGAGTGASGAGIALTSNTGVGENWAMLVSSDNFDDSLGFYDTTNGIEVLKFYRHLGEYTIAPSEDGIATVKLGDHTDNDLRFDECAAAKFYERNDAGLGYWTTVAFNAANFTASAGAWTVDAADQVEYKYTLVGKTMVLSFFINNTDVSALSQLRLAIPGGMLAANTARTLYWAVNAGAGAVPAVCAADIGNAFITLFADVPGNPFGITAADNTTVAGQITFEVQ